MDSVYYPAQLRAINAQSGSSWRQWLKWAVYTLLFADFNLYLVQDAEAARYTLDAESGLLEILAAYVTSIDLIAWFALILLFELETWVLAGRAWTGPASWAVRGVRVVCYVAILHTSFSYEISLQEFRHPERLPPAADVCAYAGDGTFLRNRDYLEIDAQNCASIGVGPDFSALSDDAVLTDRAGLEEGTILAWTDLLESLSWLFVVFATDAIVRLGHTAYASGSLAVALARLKFVFYALILAIAAYWGSKGQVFYFWDEIVWVLGFLDIDRNIRDWRRPWRSLTASPTAA